MDNDRSNYFPVTSWHECCHSNSYSNPLFYPIADCGDSQQPSLLYTDLPGGHVQSINLTGPQTIVYPRATLPERSFHTLPYQGNCGNNSSFRTRQLNSAYATTQQIPFCDDFSQIPAIISGHHPCKPSGDQYTVDPQAVLGSMICPTGYMQTPYVTPSVPKEKVTFKGFGPKRPVRDADWRCPTCSAPLGRSPDRMRHILSHLPQWLQCPDLGCSWRGDRWETLNKHWHKVHSTSSPRSDKNECTIYYPWPLVRGIIKGTTVIQDARVLAISMVEKRALELGKSGLWGDFWGRKERKTRKRGWSVFSDTISYLP